MIPRSPTTASSRPSRRMRLLVLIYLVCLGRVTASSKHDGKIQPQQQTKNPAIAGKNFNNLKVAESTNDIPDKAYRQSRALPRFENSEAVESSEEDSFLESVQKSPSETSSLYVIPHLRPGRTSTQILDSGESDEMENIIEDKRNSYTAIPMLRYGRSSLIPAPRFGRSIESSEESSPDLSYGNILDHQDKEEISDYNAIEQIKKNDMIPIPRYGRSESIIPMPRFGRSSSLIPMARYGRTASLIPMARYGRSDSLIPMARYGRSDSLIPMARYGRSDSLIPMARYGRSDSLIPMARYGRSDSLIPMMRYGRSDLIPMARYGRSDLIPMARYGRSDLIPMARYGRSDLIPMARYGRSDTLIPTARYGRSSSLIPMARYGRSDSLIPIPRFGKSAELFENSDFDSDGIRSERISEGENNLESLKSSKRSIDENGAIIPYPRPGREIEIEVEKKKDELKSSDSEVRRQTNESLIPQIRYGRSSGKTKIPENEQSHIFILPNIRPGRSSKEVNNKEKEKSKSAQYGLLPYPRPGRSGINQENKEKNYDDLNEDLDSILDIKRSEEGTGDQIILEFSEEDFSLDPSYLKSAEDQHLINSDKESSRFVIPYPRPGKRDLSEEQVPPTVSVGNTNSYPHLFKIAKGDDENVRYSSSYSNSEKEGSGENSGNEMPLETEVSFKYLSNPHLRFQKRSILSDKPTFLVSHPRLGRSSSLLPYPRLGRSNTILPLPRPGRSNTVLPYPRPGRSHSILPYQRYGRSTNIVPYPRPGRSTNIVPYPRPGRSTNIVPYPRPGRSTNIVPYPRPGRSANIVPYPRPGRSTTIVPIPRPGRSLRDEVLKRNVHEHLLPYSQTENNSEFSATFFQDDPESQYPKLKDIPSLVKKLNKEISSSNPVYILPYPRPGRSSKRNLA